MKFALDLWIYQTQTETVGGLSFKQIIFVGTYTYSPHCLHDFRPAVWTWNFLPSNELKKYKEKNSILQFDLQK